MRERLSDEQTRAMIKDVNGNIKGFLKEISQKACQIGDGGSLEDVKTAQEMADLAEVVHELKLFRIGLRVALGELPPHLALGGRQFRFDTNMETINQGGQTNG